eukprot:7728899-Prorocentrum_lima.AAC.1
MTSSLVGSEDVYKRQFSARAFLSKSTDMYGIEQAVKMVVSWAWQQPVSYTHLTLPTICSV